MPVPGDTISARRKQKSYADALGRDFKQEMYAWNGSTVYSAVVNTYNPRDQVTQTREYNGSTSSTDYQDTTSTYDGHGRMVNHHRPEQMDEEENPLSTTYTYNADDSVASVTDARGAGTNYDYNGRGLLEEVSYSVPGGSSIAVAPSVSFEYDDLGNRTLMTDGLGTLSYDYSELSQITAETRHFTDTLTSAPLSSNGYKLEYTYTLGGQLKSYKDPFGTVVSYVHDKSGRLDGVNGSGTGGSRTYASNSEYRAWGTLKHLEYGNGTKFDITSFNDKLQPTIFDVKDGDNTSIIKKEYEYYNDGSLKYMQDDVNDKFDRSYVYDNVGRTIKARTGAEARGSTDDAENLPYHHDYGYDAFGHTTAVSAVNYSSPPFTLTSVYTNNREGAPPNGNDEENYPKYASDTSLGLHLYNSAGQLDFVDSDAGITKNNSIKGKNFYYDGNNLLVKKAITEQEGENTPTVTKTYDIRSTVLKGEVITEIEGSSGQKSQTYVRANGTNIALNYTSVMYWTHKDPTLSSVRSTDGNGDMVSDTSGGNEISQLELDPQGNNVGFTDWWQFSEGGTAPDDPVPGNDLPHFETITNGNIVRNSIDGISVPRDYFNIMIEFAYGGMFGLSEHLSRPTLLHATVTHGEDSIYPITIRRWWLAESSLTDFSFTDRQQTKDVPFDVAKIKAVIGKLLENKTCKDFIANLLSKAAEKTGVKIAEGGNILDMIDKVTNFTRTAPAKSAGYGNAMGTFKGKDASIYGLGNASKDSDSQLVDDVNTVIHEILHLAGYSRKFSDRDFADIVHSSSDAAIPFEGPYPIRDPYGAGLSAEDKKTLKNDPGNLLWSGYWARVLDKKCFRKANNDSIDVKDLIPR